MDVDKLKRKADFTSSFWLKFRPKRYQLKTVFMYLEWLIKVILHLSHI